MTKPSNALANRDEAATDQPQQRSQIEKIKSQVLAKIGNLPRLHRVEISRHHNGKYRVNIWQQTEPDKDVLVTTGLRIGLSYYLTVSNTGEIIHSNPPMVKVGSQV